jgi:hypothetical protein
MLTSTVAVAKDARELAVSHVFDFSLRLNDALVKVIGLVLSFGRSAHYRGPYHLRFVSIDGIQCPYPNS